MCGILGIVSKRINEKKAFLALDKLQNRGPDEENSFRDEGVFLGHKRLVVVDRENGKQPYIYQDYAMVYNGELYNTEELRGILLEKGYTFSGYSDTEVLLKMYVEFKEDCLEKLNGIFAFAVWNKKTKELFACRDRVGVKPLYFYNQNKEFMCSSEIKSILSYYNIHEVGIEGLQEMLGLGPSHTAGNGIYKNVQELRAGHYIIYKDKKLSIKRYWNVKAFTHIDNFKTTVNKTRELLTDSIQRQLVSDVPLCTFLSGGLDSSIITIIAKQNKPEVESFSIDYKDNDKYFLKNDFQVSQDKEFIQKIVEQYDMKHNSEIINNQELVNALDDALILKDYPGMVDIDSSLYWFAKQIKKRFTVGLSGECADEIFGGYPWFYKEKFENNFPWIRNMDERETLLNPKYQKKLQLKEYVSNRLNDTLRETPLCGQESDSEKKHKQLVYLNMIWFMQTLLDRKDRMTMGASLEVRVPFADHRLIEYLYNVPWEFKFYHQMEKGLLREAVKDFVPEEIVKRKKNPYPKTHNPIYLNSVKEKLNTSLKNKDSILYEVFNTNELEKLITEDSPLEKPWFGQLMNRPQLIAYLYQFDLWFKEYGLNIVK